MPAETRGSIYAADDAGTWHDAAHAFLAPGEEDHDGLERFARTHGDDVGGDLLCIDGRPSHPNDEPMEVFIAAGRLFELPDESLVDLALEGEPYACRDWDEWFAAMDPRCGYYAAD